MTLLTKVLLGVVLATQAGTWRSSASLVEIDVHPSTVTLRNTGMAGADFWRPADAAASGSYTVRATLRKLAGRRMEGYGILIGARALGTDSARYAYVMLRGDGALLIKKRNGAVTPVVRDWAPYPAIRPDDAQGRAENQLEIRVTPREVAVSVNGTALVTVPVSEVYTDGVIGLRLSHTVALEVRDLTVAPSR